ncbi:MAG: hypothetical protein V3S11_06380 [Elusimicrobiota bacterium]
MGLTQLPPAVAGGAAILAFLALVLLIAFLLALKRGSRLSGELAALQDEMTALKSAPKRHEYRLEQYDILWYPVLTLNEAQKKILKATAGFPYCKDCGERIKEMDGGVQWGCPKCDFRCAASVTDVVVMDSVNAKVVKFYQQRHPGFELAEKSDK